MAHATVELNLFSKALLLHFTYFVCERTEGHTACMACVWRSGDSSGSLFLLPSCGLCGLNSCCQTWQWAPLWGRHPAGPYLLEYARTCVRVCASVHSCVRVHVSVHTHVRVCMCALVCAHSCVHVCLCVCSCARVHVCVCMLYGHASSNVCECLCGEVLGICGLCEKKLCPAFSWVPEF